MAIQLRVLTGKDSGKTFVLKENETFLIGRDMGTNTRLKDPHVAMLHCQLVLQGTEAVVADRNSTGGTFVNGQRATEGRLRLGEKIRVGDTHLIMEEKPVVKE